MKPARDPVKALLHGMTGTLRSPGKLHFRGGGAINTVYCTGAIGGFYTSRFVNAAENKMFRLPKVEIRWG